MDPNRELIATIDSKVEALLQSLGGRGSGAPSSSGFDAGLLEAIARLSGTLDEASLYEDIVAGAAAVTRAQRSFLMLLEEGSKLRWKAGFGLTQQSLMSKGFDGSRSIIKEVVTSGIAVLRGVGGAPASDSMVAGGLKNALCVPVPCGERIRRSNSAKGVAGVLYVDSAGMAEPLQRSQLTTLEQFARHASLALENAWLYAGEAGL